MSRPRAIWAIARADFLERVRRYSFLVTLLFAVYLGYAAATGRISLRLGYYRGLYTSAWIGAIVSLVTTTFVSLVGFYIVKNAVDRDRQTGVGQILASAPLSRSFYLLGKFISNFAVLASLVGVLALAAFAMQFLVAEDRVFHAWPLFSPFLLLSLPAMAVTAAVALLFETIQLLRGGFGNILWFFLWSLSIGLPGVVEVPQLDPSGLWTVFRSMVPAAQATIPGYKGEFSLSVADKSIKVFPSFHWDGIDWTTGEVLLRLGWVLAALALVLLAATFFDRFDPARSRWRSRAKPKQGGAAPEVEVDRVSSSARGRTAVHIHLTPLGEGAYAPNFPRICFAELRLAVKGYRWWWYAVAAGLLIAQFAAPLDVSHGPLLTAAWIWPILIWSGLGTREKLFGTQQLLFSCPHILLRQLSAAWLAGVVIAALLGGGAAFRLAIAGQITGFLAWAVGAVFVPSLALALGVWSGTSRFFEGFYTALWYIGPLNRVPGIDFTGGGSGALAGRFAVVYLGITAILVGAAFFRRAHQLSGT
jgi:hypothetical protein